MRGTDGMELLNGRCAKLNGFEVLEEEGGERRGGCRGGA